MPRCLSPLLLVLGVSIAHAQSGELPDMKPAAKIYEDQGKQKMLQHDYAEAIAAFDAGYAIDPHPKFLYDKAQAQRLGGDCRKAIITYQAYLATEPTKEYADLAHANVAKCEQVLAASNPKPETGSGAQPSDDGVKVSTTTPPPPHERPVVDSEPWWHDNAGLALAGSGVVVFGISAFAAWRANVNADLATNANTIDDWTSAYNDWNTDRIIAGVAAAAGAALIVGSGIRFVYASQRDHVTTAAVPGHGGGMIVVGGQF